MNYKSLFYILICFVFISCEKEEIPVKPFDRGDAITTVINMEQNYKYQVYYDLASNSVISTNVKTDWDIAFDCGEGNHITLNASKSMFVLKKTETNFAAVTDTNGLRNNRTWDASSGNLDSTAFGDLTDFNSVYIIDRGYNEMGMAIGFKKLQIISIDNNNCTFRYANLNGSDERTVTVTKNTDYNSVAFSFNTNGVKYVEPMKSSYDLQFTSYTYTFHNPYQPYSVTGVLHNRTGVSVGIDKQRPFQEIELKDTMHYIFNKNIDAIGYEWKVFSIDANKYTVNPNIIYIVKDRKGFFYKLHFVDFYNESGQKGYPKFEVQKL